MSWFWPRGASGSQRDGVVQLVCSSVVRRTRGQPTGAGITCESADLQKQSLLVSYWTLANGLHVFGSERERVSAGITTVI